MLAIRLQRRGRSSHAQYRVIVQDSRFSPKSEKIVYYLGSYDPHSNVAVLDKDKSVWYMEHGARPSNRVAKLFKAEKIKLPSWVSIESSKKRSTKNPEKLRKNQPAEPKKTKADIPTEETEAASGPNETEKPSVDEKAAKDETPAEADEAKNEEKTQASDEKELESKKADESADKSSES